MTKCSEYAEYVASLLEKRKEMVRMIDSKRSCE